MTSPAIQWYPGHIAKAEKALQEQLKRVDVVIEVRDARIPLSTHHPQLLDWIGEKQRILILNRVDMISPRNRESWDLWFREQGTIPFFTNAQQGKGVVAVAKAAQAAGAAMNQKRCDRGMRPRPVRSVVLGFPNVGKSALINRLLNRRVVESARRAGVTRQLRWVRISDELELLDSPGVLPANLTHQEIAVKLAICDDIGEAAYDNQLIAAAFLDLIKDLQWTPEGAIVGQTICDRYHIDLTEGTGEACLAHIATHRFKGDIQRVATQLLNDFRKGTLGTLALELPYLPPDGTPPTEQT